MKIEKLISAYLDGELSREQDKQLRDAITSDESIKREFDSSVDIHLAMKEDAKSITTPDDLVHQTEDIVMMKILNNNKQTEVVRSKRRKPVFYYFSAAAIVLMFGLLFRIYEPGAFNQLLEQNQQSYSNQFIEDINPDSFEMPVPPIAEFTSNIEAVKSANKSNNFKVNENDYAKIVENISGSDLIVSDDLQFNNIFANTQNKLQPNLKISHDLYPAFDESIDSDIIFAASIKELPKYNVLMINNLSPEYSYVPSNPLLSANNSIKLSSFVSNSIMNNGINTDGSEPVINYSQSVAYHSSESLSFGLEFGYMEFNSQRNVKSSGGGKGQFDLPTSVEVQNPANGDNFVPPSLPVIVNNQLFWGSVFVNYDLFDYRKFTLETRLGAGATSSGPLGYSRISAKYRLTNNLFLNIGTEGRWFVYRLDSDNLNGTSLSLIYGIQFAF